MSPIPTESDLQIVDAYDALARDDNFRHQALEQAVALAKHNGSATDVVVEAAEKFYQFLKGTPAS